MFRLNTPPSPKSDRSLPAWTQVLTTAIIRFSHASVLWENYIITFGGEDECGQFYPDVHALDLITQTQVVPREAKMHRKPTSRYGHSMCLDQRGNAIIFGGRFNNVVLDSCIGFHLSLSEEGELTITWKSLTEMRARNDPDDRPCVYRHTANIHNDKMYVFGGRKQDERFTNDLWELDLSTFLWRKCAITGQIPEPCANHSSSICNGKLYIFGGIASGRQSENCLFMLDLETFRWDSIKATGAIPQVQIDTTMQEYKGKLIIFGGTLDWNNRSANEIFTFCTQTNTWTQIQTSGKSPRSRCMHTSVVWKNQLYVLGGFNHQDRRWLGFDCWALCLDDLECFKDSLNKPDSSDKGLKIENDPFNLIELFKQKSFTDISLEVEGKEFASHKAILAQRCKFFDNLFNSGMSDSNLSRLPITDVKADSFETMLRFIYNDPNLVIDEDQAFELLSLSDKYLLPTLKIQCEKVLIKLLTVENFVKIAKAAEVVESDEMKKAVFKFARENIPALKEKGDLYVLSHSLLIEFFANIVSK